MVLTAGTIGIVSAQTDRPRSNQLANEDVVASRYIDGQGQPVTHQRMRDALLGQNNAEKDIPLAVAKQVPVYLKVGIEQRSIPKLLAACANAVPAIEIKNLRIISPTQSSTNSSVTAEIFGVIRVYNPVDEAILRVPSVATKSTDRERG